MSQTNLCESMNCPFWKGFGYGECTRYTVAMHCLGAAIKNVEATQYSLSIDSGKISGQVRALMEFAIADASGDRKSKSSASLQPLES